MYTLPIIGPFRVLLCLCFKASLSAKPFLWKWLWFAWKWNCMQNSFSYERFRTWTRFETEAQENSEMAYLSIRNVLGSVNLYSRSCEDLVISVVFIKTCKIHVETSPGYFFLPPENSRKNISNKYFFFPQCEIIWIQNCKLFQPTLILQNQIAFKYINKRKSKQTNKQTNSNRIV